MIDTISPLNPATAKNIAPGMLAPILLLALVMAGPLAGGCSMAPRYARPDLPTPPVYGENTIEVADSSAARADTVARLEDWRRQFPQPVLQGLIDVALQNNRDLRVAALRVDEARAYYRIQVADRLPSVAAGGGYMRGREVQLGPDNTSTRTPVVDGYNVSLGVTAFELDLFGRVKSLSDAALARYLATDEGRRATEISLVAEVVNLYMAERALADQEKLTRETLESREDTRRLTQKRFDAGMASAIEMRSHDMLVESSRSVLAEYQRQRAYTRNALKLLLGDPGYTLPEDAPSLDEFSFAALAPGLPSELLERRPDIRSAEQTLKASNADIGAARAAFFPRISLTTEIGRASPQISDLFAGGAGFWSFVPNLVMPIFQGGRNIANLDLANVRKEISVAQYEKAVQTAFTEVMDCLQAGEFLENQIVAQQKVSAADKERLRLVTLRYDRGMANYLEILDAQRSLFESDRELIRLKGVRLTNSIMLYKSLGGGWKL